MATSKQQDLVSPGLSCTSVYRSGVSTAYKAFLGALLIWVAAWLYFSRYLMLDDALIHLRYAAYLHDLGFISFDGVHHSYGTSSLLYVLLLAFFRSVTQSPMLPKVVSSCAYLVVLTGASAFALRRHTRTPSSVLATGAVICLASPMAIRWLTDGMETSLVTLAAILFAALIYRGEREPISLPLGTTLFAAGFLIVILRVELSVLVALGSLAIFASRLSVRRSGLIATAWSSSYATLGALAGMATIRWIMGALLPDSAVAKAGSAHLAVLTSTFITILAAASFGVGITLLWAASAVLSFRALRGRREAMAAWVVINSTFPLVLAIAVGRCQIVQGFRHVLWAFVFPLAWNVLHLQGSEERRGSSAIGHRSFKIAIAVCILAILGMWTFEIPVTAKVIRGRSDTFLKMRAADMSAFAGKTLVSGDIGFISYFSRAYVCDLAGLVNGREAARQSGMERSKTCAAGNPDLMFLDEHQARNVDLYRPLEQWIVCTYFDFTNVNSRDRHYLLVPPAAATACAPFGDIAGTAGDVIPTLHGTHPLRTTPAGWQVVDRRYPGPKTVRGINNSRHP